MSAVQGRTRRLGRGGTIAGGVLAALLLAGIVPRLAQRFRQVPLRAKGGKARGHHAAFLAAAGVADQDQNAPATAPHGRKWRSRPTPRR